MKLMIALFILSPVLASAAPLSYESIQLQKLISKSEEQIKEAQELIKYSKKDSRSLEKAEQILNDLSAGMGQSIKQYQGTKIYAKALLQLQSEKGFVSGSSADPKLNGQKLDNFQTSSVAANSNDLETQDKLQQALNTAQPGFVPKVQAQAQIGQWQTSIRSSAQLTQILATLNGLRQDLNGHGEGSGGVGTLLQGAQSQNDKLRTGAIDAPR